MKIISVDVEEWFHLLYLDSAQEKQWHGLESRLDRGIDELLGTFENYGIKATFFCLGSVAKSHQSVIRKIHQAGHEVASHGFSHELVPKLHTEKFAADLRESIDILEQITGNKVVSYRAPGFSITQDNLWVFETLLESGIQNDSSIVIGKSNHGGWHQCKENAPFQLTVNGGTIKEFPINTSKILGYRTIFGGGGYFRFFPYPLVKNWTKRSNYAMAYFHYRDFDPGQPKLKNLGHYEKFRAYYGLHTSMAKLHRYLNDFHFIDLAQADQQTDWAKAKTIDLTTSSVFS